MAKNRIAFGKAAAMNVAMQIIHHNHPEFRYRQFVLPRPANVDDYRVIFPAQPFA
jgi:hypothetical protein